MASTHVPQRLHSERENARRTEAARKKAVRLARQQARLTPIVDWTIDTIPPPPPGSKIPITKKCRSRNCWAKDGSGNNIPLPWFEFNKHTAAPDGLQDECNTCRQRRVWEKTGVLTETARLREAYAEIRSGILPPPPRPATQENPAPVTPPSVAPSTTKTPSTAAAVPATHVPVHVHAQPAITPAVIPSGVPYLVSTAANGDRWAFPIGHGPAFNLGKPGSGTVVMFSTLVVDGQPLRITFVGAEAAAIEATVRMYAAQFRNTDSAAFEEFVLQYEHELAEHGKTRSELDTLRTTSTNEKAQLAAQLDAVKTDRDSARKLAAEREQRRIELAQRLTRVEEKLRATERELKITQADRDAWKLRGTPPITEDGETMPVIRKLPPERDRIPALVNGHMNGINGKH